MRATSFRRRSAGGQAAKVGGVRAQHVTRGKDLTVPEGTPDSRRCHCGANLPVLANGNLKGHAPGGVTASFSANRFRCEGSGNTGQY